MLIFSRLDRETSVRSTNVYEEQSLGVFRDEPDPPDEDNFQPTGESRVAVWSSYLAMHARKQLAFGTIALENDFVPVLTFRAPDMWWLGLAVFLVCIIEVCYAFDIETSCLNILPSGTTLTWRKMKAGSTYSRSVSVAFSNYMASLIIAS